VDDDRPDVEDDQDDDLDEDREPGAWAEDLDVPIYADSSLTLPGMGDPGKNCGEAIPIEFCEKCGEPHFSTVSCDQRQCPDCWESWRGDRTEGVVRRLAAARRAAGDGLDRRALHAVVSPPEGEVRSLTDVSQMMRRAYDLAREAGMRGGVAIPHGWRVTDSAEREWRASDSDRGIWAWIREREEDWRTATYWSPHVHIIGLAREFGPNQPEEQDGWVVERIRSLDEWSLTDPDGYEDMARATGYLLSHAAYEPESNTDSVRWWGDLHPSNFSPDGDLDDGALPSLSEGVYKVIRRYSQEAVGVDLDEMEEPSECQRDGCSGRRRTIHQATDWLQDREWCEQIGAERERRLATAIDWLCGDVRPPPGMCNPATPEEAEEALEAILERL
jgi:hypothetical protein